MTAQKFKQVIQQIVREEIKKSLPKMVSKILSENTNNTESEDSFFDELKKELSSTTPIVQQKQKSREVKKYSNNPVLNQILNETQGGIPKETLPPNINEMFLKPERQELNIFDATPKKQKMQPSVVSDPEPTIAPTLLTEETKAQAQIGVFKDYRKLMKAMDKKKNSSFGGMGNSMVSMDGNINPSDFNNLQ
jgi:hypothetical protein